MFVVLQHYRINLDNVYEYYIDNKILYVVDTHGNRKSYFFKSEEKAKKTLQWLDIKTKAYQRSF